jgi:UDP-N-acetylmuramate: L-alanyl-gamma-D-glutamyl-meso-diaminopimelate ligase
VAVGTAGKTTTTALTVHILRGLGYDPSYMIGAELADGSPALQQTKSLWSVMEGDEFYGVEIEPHSKFFEYRPKFVYLNKITWDHADVFPTEEIYIENFRQLLQKLPGDGLVMANAADENIRRIASSARCQVKWFAADAIVPEFINSEETKLYWHVENTEGKLTIVAPPISDFRLPVETKLIGKYNQQNVLAVVAMLYELFADNIDWRLVQKLIAEFQGIHKRLEVLHSDAKLVVVDDLGGPPLKVRTGLEALHGQYPQHKIIVAYEPNSGNRKLESINEYKNTMELADLVIIPTLSDSDPTLLTAPQLIAELNKLGIDRIMQTDSENLNELIKQNLASDRPNLVVYFSSYRLTQLARDFGKGNVSKA